MRMAFLDLATRTSGWCVGGGDNLPAVGAWPWPQVGQAYGELLDHFERDLSVLISTQAPEIIGYESPIKTQRDDLERLRKLYSLGCFLEFVCHRRGIRCVEVDLRTIKKELGGSSKADKGSMVAAAEKVGLGERLPKTKAAGREDAADAFGGWLVLVRLYASRDISAKWDRALWGSRTALL